ncbi:hypothetical protein GOP47_0013350 [Adiantum capillus-veneris]|uniref:Glycosyltransferase n=2 Tax=Adiantum capillus-veneris TaxID=13818 RepID=A0A9D4UNX4_ADICA|nr:hypothetical protein GOP47_0013350 [Adiantum capillus-veneris]
MGVHVLLVPWSAQGHLTPVLQLARVLACNPEFLITLVLNARASARVESASSALPRHHSIKVQVICDGLNPDPSHTPSMDDVVASVPIMQQNLQTLVGDLMASPHPVTCLISGTFCYWSKSVARAFNIPRVELWSSPAFIYSIGFFHHRLIEEGLVPLKGQRSNTWITGIPGLPPMKATEFVKELTPTEEEIQADPEKVPRMLKRLQNTYSEARDQYRILVNSIYDLESQSFDALCEEQVHAYAVGPLFLHNVGVDASNQRFTEPRTSLYKEDRSCLQWLGSRAPASTLYVAFGSDSRMEKQDIQELALGLEASGHNFLWAIRPGSIVGDLSVADVLPEGFEERVANRGLIVSWAPQTDVLSHSAIGGFLSHCGWNSTLEALWMGVPILGWPQRADQGVNQFFIREVWKVGLAVEMDEDSKVSRISIEKAVRLLMVGEEGSLAREKVKEVKKLMLKVTNDGGSSRRNLDQFIQDLYHLAQDRCST